MYFLYKHTVTTKAYILVRFWHKILSIACKTIAIVFYDQSTLGMCFSIVFVVGLVDLMSAVDLAVAALSSPAHFVVAPVVTAAGLLAWFEWSSYHTIHAEGEWVFYLHQDSPSFVYYKDYCFRPASWEGSFVSHYSWQKVRVSLVNRRQFCMQAMKEELH